MKDGFALIARAYASSAILGIWCIAAFPRIYAQMRHPSSEASATLLFLAVYMEVTGSLSPFPAVAKDALLSFVLVFTASAPQISSAEPQTETEALTPEVIALEQQSEEFDREQAELLSGGGVAEADQEDAEEYGGKSEPAILREPDVRDPLPDAPGEEAYKDENSITYETGEREFVTRVFSEPVLYTDENGRKREIDNTITPESGGYTNKAAAYDVDLPKEGGKVKIGYDGVTIGISPLFGDLGNAVHEENAIRYNSVADGVDLQYTIFGSSVKEDIILMKPTGMKSFEYRATCGKDTVLREVDGYHRGIQRRGGAGTCRCRLRARNDRRGRGGIHGCQARRAGKRPRIRPLRRT